MGSASPGFGTYLRGHWTLVYLCSWAKPAGLQDARDLFGRYQDSRLHLLVLEAERRSTAEALGLNNDKRMAVGSMPALSRQALHLPTDSKYVWTIFVDPGGRAVFFVPRAPSLDDLSQLVERYLQATPAALSSERAQRLEFGLRNLQVTRVGDGWKGALKDALLGVSDVLLFGPSTGCDPCDADRVNASLPGLAKLSHSTGRSSVALLTREFSPNAEALRATTASVRIYVMESILPEMQSLPGTPDVGLVVHLQAIPDRPHVETFASWHKQAADGDTVTTSAPSGQRTGPPFELCPDGDVGGLRSVTHSGGIISALDAARNHILQFEANGRYLGSIGQIGQAPGDLYRTRALASDKAGRVYVLNQTSSRVDAFDQGGQLLSTWPVDTNTDSIAVTSTGDVLVNGADNGKPVEVLGHQGAPLRSFGAMLSAQELDAPSDLDLRKIAMLNRAQVIVSRDDDIYLVYKFAPFVAKYSLDGQLRWRRKLVGGSLDSLTQAVWKEEVRPGLVRSGFDGVTLPLVSRAATVTSRNRILVLLNDASFTILSDSGEVVQQSEKPLGIPPSATSIAEADGLAYFVSPHRCVQAIRSPER